MCETTDARWNTVTDPHPDPVGALLTAHTLAPGDLARAMGVSYMRLWTIRRGRYPWREAEVRAAADWLAAQGVPIDAESLRAQLAAADLSVLPPTYARAGRGPDTPEALRQRRWRRRREEQRKDKDSRTTAA